MLIRYGGYGEWIVLELPTLGLIVKLVNDVMVSAAL